MSIPCGNIVIDGGSITATGGTNSAAIGGGVFSKCGTITITKNTERVTATKGDDTPYSIGAGKEGTCGIVTIDGVEGAIAMSSYTYQLVDLSTISADYTVYGVRPLTGALGVNVNISIADGSAVILRNAAIDVEHSWSATWAGLKCKGDATIFLDGSNTVKSCNIYCPGIHIPEGYTLTIKGKGSLTALAHPGDGGRWAAAIGGGWHGKCGDITITKNVTKVTAISPRFSSCSIGAGDGGTCGTVTIGGEVTGSIEQSPYIYEP